MLGPWALLNSVKSNKTRATSGFLNQSVGNITGRQQRRFMLLSWLLGANVSELVYMFCLFQATCRIVQVYTRWVQENQNDRHYLVIFMKALRTSVMLEEYFCVESEVGEV